MKRTRTYRVNREAQKTQLYMESPAAAVVRICGYPDNFALARAFVKFQTLPCQTVHAFLSILTFQAKDPHCVKHDTVWNIDAEDRVLSRLSTVLEIIRDRECEPALCEPALECARLSRKGTAKIIHSRQQSAQKEWCVVRPFCKRRHVRILCVGTGYPMRPVASFDFFSKGRMCQKI